MTKCPTVVYPQSLTSSRKEEEWEEEEERPHLLSKTHEAIAKEEERPIEILRG